jgi:very-short-patch-repair endonuclease
MDARALVVGHGGALDRHRLVELGATDHDLRVALKSGGLNRPRRGWYSSWREDDPRFRAMRVGGRLTGLSAIAALGGWVLGEHPIHVAVPTNAARLRSQWRRDLARADARPDGVVVHWVAASHDRFSSTGVVPLFDALVLVCRSASVEQAIAALDWARHSGRVDVIEVAQLQRQLGALGWLVEASEWRCESLPESLARTRCSAAGWRVTAQVPWRPGLERIDLVIEGSVALETDGEEFHRDTFEEDRARDLSVVEAGMHAVRASARQVFTRWPLVQSAVEAALAERGILVRLHNSGVASVRRPATRRRPLWLGDRERGSPELWR